MRLRPKLNKKSKNAVNTFRLLLLLCGLVSLTSFTRQRIKGKGITTVVIDAGHGGHDSGCLGSHAKEKDVTLAVALKLGKFISDNYKDIKVIYTRKTDVFIPLDERAAVANNNKADLFISVHCNSGAKAAYGVETYVMGLHRTDENLAVSKRENSVVLLEKDYKTRYDGFDPDSPEGNIIFTLYQNAYLDQSLRISTLVQMEASDFAGRYNRGVKQAGFLVLYKTTMPSMLIETGFLTNPAEERYLLSKEGQEKLAYSFFRAFQKYKAGTTTSVPEGKEIALDSSDKRGSLAPADTAPDVAEKTSEPKPEIVKPIQQPAEEPKKSVVKPPAEKTSAPAESTAVKTKADTMVKAKAADKIVTPALEPAAIKPQRDTASKAKRIEKVPVAVAETTAVKPQKDTALKASTQEKAPAPAASSPVIKPQRDTIAKANPSAEKVPATSISTAVKPPVVDAAVKTKQLQPEITKELSKPESAAGEVYFSVQIATSGKLLSESSPVFKGEKNIISENVNGLFKYMTGKYTTLGQATERQNQLRAAGFADAFVVVYHNGSRITLKEAKMLLEKN